VSRWLEPHRAFEAWHGFLPPPEIRERRSHGFPAVRAGGIEECSLFERFLGFEMPGQDRQAVTHPVVNIGEDFILATSRYGTPEGNNRLRVS
jgi:hypothetical protein